MRVPKPNTILTVSGKVQWPDLISQRLSDKIFMHRPQSAPGFLKWHENELCPDKWFNECFDRIFKNASQ